MNYGRPRFIMRRRSSAKGTLLGRAALGCLLSVAGFPAALDAHPMGNFSISHYAGITVGRDFIELRYLVDMAEIPTFQEIQAMQKLGIVLRSGDPSLASYLAREAEILEAGLTLEIDGQALPLRVSSKDVIFPPGAGGLPTMKLGFVYRVPLRGRSGVAASRLEYHDRNFPDRAGWKEVIAVEGQGVEFASSSVPGQDRSQQLSNYPTDLLNSPPQVLDAEVNFARNGSMNPPLAAASGLSAGKGSKPQGRTKKLGSDDEQGASARLSKSARDIASAASALGPVVQTPSPEAIRLHGNQQGTPRNRFTELIAARQFGFWFLLTAALIAAGLGAFHALEPGHGKTIVAAYLVGSGGTATHACLLGLIVTASHTAGVYVLGAVTLYASRYIVPDRLYPWLGALSGLVIAGLGVMMFLRRYAGHTPGHSHSHGHHHHSHGLAAGHVHDHEHRHGGEHHDHDHHHDHHGPHHHHQHPEPGQKVSYRQLLALGVTGGMVPCPAALVVLLSAVALHRIAFGLFLIVAFSVGLAAVLISIGLLMVYAGRFMSRVQGEGTLITRWLPLGSAAVITILGVAIATQSLIAGGILQVRI